MVLIHTNPSFLPQMFTFVTLGPEIPSHRFLAAAPARTPLSPGAEQGGSQGSAHGERASSSSVPLCILTGWALTFHISLGDSTFLPAVRAQE